MAFDSPTGPILTLPPRAGKPRRRGITSMIDFGPDTFGWTGGESGIRNVLEVAAGYIDYAKIYAAMNKPAFVFDGRNILDLPKLAALGFRAHGVGK